MSLFSRIKVKIANSKYCVYFYIFKALRRKIRLAFGIFASLLYIIWNTVLAAIYADALLFSVSVYYLTLAVMRYTLFRVSEGKNSLAYRAALRVGVLLLVSDAAMGGIIVYTLMRGSRKRYSPITLIPQALFLLYCLFGAIIRISRHKKASGAIDVSVDVISLAAAFFSVFNLVNYLSHVEVVGFDRVITLIVGLLAVFTVLFAAIFLIVKNLRSINAEQ